MSVQLIEHLLADPDPAFACYANGDGSRTEGFVVPLVHLANPPADAPALSRIPHIPGAATAREFYAAHDGALLYTTREECVEGIEIFPIEQWPERTAQMVDSWREDT